MIISIPWRPCKHRLYPFGRNQMYYIGLFTRTWFSYRRGLWRCLFNYDRQLLEPQEVEWTTGRFHAFLCQIVANLMQDIETIWTHWLMRIPIEVEADLLTLDLSPMSSPKHNAHIQGCPRTMHKRKITNGSCCELHTTEHRKHMASYQPLTFGYICLCIMLPVGGINLVHT